MKKLNIKITNYNENKRLIEPKIIVILDLL